MSSPELPFVARGGNDNLTALHNRIAALDRIKFLTGVDLKDRSTEYKQLIDCELYVKYYKNNPTEPISEEWCQRAAEIINILEKEKQEDLNKTLEGVPDRVEQLYKESKQNIPIHQPPLKNIVVPNKPKWYEFYKKIVPRKV